MRDTIEQIEAGIAAYRKKKRRQLNRAAAQPERDSDLDDEQNLADDVPDDAWSLWQELPDDPRDEAYRADLADELGVSEVPLIDAASRNDDFTSLVEEAVDETAILDLGSGTYEMDETAAIRWGDLFAVVGDGSDDATIRWDGPLSENADEYPNYEDDRHGPGLLFSTQAGDVERGYLYGVTVDIEGESEPGLNRDAGIMRTKVTDELWVNDVVLRGERHRYQQIDGELRAVGYGPTLQAGAIETDATMFFNDVQLTDGQRYVDIDRDNHFGQGSAVTFTNPHSGTAVLKEVRVHEWSSSGFYLANRPDREASRNVLWDCEAVDCSAGQMRVGYNATIVGGRSERTDYWSGVLSGKCLEVQEGTDVEAIGLRIEGTDYSNAIQIRSDARELDLDRVVLRTDEDSGTPVSFRGDDTDIGITDCYWYDANDSRSGQVVDIPSATVTANGWELLGAGGDDEVQVSSSSSLTVDGDSVASGTSHSAAELGLDDPRPLPEFGFDYSARE